MSTWRRLKLSFKAKATRVKTGTIVVSLRATVVSITLDDINARTISHTHAPRREILQHAARDHRCCGSKLARASAAALSRGIVSHHARASTQNATTDSHWQARVLNLNATGLEAAAASSATLYTCCRSSILLLQHTVTLAAAFNIIIIISSPFLGLANATCLCTSSASAAGCANARCRMEQLMNEHKVVNVNRILPLPNESNNLRWKPIVFVYI